MTIRPAVLPFFEVPSTVEIAPASLFGIGTLPDLSPTFRAKIGGPDEVFAHPVGPDHDLHSRRCADHGFLKFTRNTDVRAFAWRLSATRPTTVPVGRSNGVY